MKVMKAFGIGVLNAVLGLFGAGFVAALCAEWYRVPSMEGQAGYFVVFLALLGLVAGFFLGVIAAGLLLPKGFWKALGLTLGGTVALLFIITGFAWLAADFPPTIDGKELTLEFEVRFPPTFKLTEQEKAENTSFVSVTRDHGDRAQRTGELRFDEAREENGSLIVPASVFLHTSDRGKALGIHVGDRPAQFYALPLPGKPTRRNMEWNDWLPGPTFGDVEKIPPQERLAVRYRVQFYVPPVAEPQQSREEVEEQARAADEAAFAALTPERPITEWLAFTHYSKEQSLREKAANAIALRPEVTHELSETMRSGDREIADTAFRSIALMKNPPAGVAPAVVEVGRGMVEEIRIVNGTTRDADPSYEGAAAVSRRFGGWHEAARILHGKEGADFLPVMREIETAARVREDSIAMRDVVRVASYYVEKWSGADPP